MKERTPWYEVNVLRPKKGYMGNEVAVILLILFLWGTVTFGFQFLLALAGSPPSWESFLTRTTVFGLPFHFWFTGQFLPLWFILLCILFNVYIDRLTERHSRKRDRR